MTQGLERSDQVKGVHQTVLPALLKIRYCIYWHGKGWVKAVGFLLKKDFLLFQFVDFHVIHFYILVYIEGLGTICRSSVFYENIYFFDTYTNRQISLDQAKYLF